MVKGLVITWSIVLLAFFIPGYKRVIRPKQLAFLLLILNIILAIIFIIIGMTFHVFLIAMMYLVISFVYISYIGVKYKNKK